MAEARAALKNCQSSPRKMRYVADVIRSMDAEKALYILQHNAKHASKDVEKLLRSAIDNWEKKNEGMRVEDAGLFVKTVFVDGGRMLKRWLPAPHGRAYKKRKRSNHITIIVDSKIMLANENRPQSDQATTAAPVEAPQSTVNETSKKSFRKKSAKKEAVNA